MQFSLKSLFLIIVAIAWPLSMASAWKTGVELGYKSGYDNGVLAGRYRLNETRARLEVPENNPDLSKVTWFVPPRPGDLQ